jgi:hypothetical protein
LIPTFYSVWHELCKTHHPWHPEKSEFVAASSSICGSVSVGVFGRQKKMPDNSKKAGKKCNDEVSSNVIVII